MLKISEITSQFYFSDYTTKSLLELLNQEFKCDINSLNEKLITSEYQVFIVTNTQNSEVCGIVAYNIINSLSSLKYLEIYNFIIKNNSNSQNYAQLAISSIEDIAKKNKCESIAVKLTTKNVFLQKIFALQKYNLDQFTFEKKIAND
jgi:hypothetical protein